MATTELCLIPSQAMMSSLSSPQSSVRSKQRVPKNKKIKGQTAYSLIPSQLQESRIPMEESCSMEQATNVNDRSSQQLNDDSLTTSPDESNKPNAMTNNSNKKKKKKASKKGKKMNSNSNNNNNNKSSASPQIRRHGNFPDVYWRCVPMDHLREHPNFVPLPLPESIDCIPKLEDIRQFRQESWQWDAVHEGRCTTSQAVAALGFLEPEAGKILGVPRSWLRGGMGAYHRLRRPALRTLEEMNVVLCSSKNTNRNDIGQSRSISTSSQQQQQQQEDSSIWLPNNRANNSKTQFAARYCIPVNQDERKERLQEMRHRYHHSSSEFDYSVRMIWGSTQESTALLTALNYFVQQVGTDVKLQEIGMCGAGIQLEGSNLILGATPDGLICHPDGRTEVLEVKNHCPFFASSTRNNNNNRSQSRYVVRPHNNLLPNGNDKSSNNKRAGVLPHYVPQLMMEMYCMGPECQSAIMVRQTATSGALIIRIHRDDGWIDEMLHWLQKFQSTYVDKGTPPPRNFFLESNEEKGDECDDDDDNVSSARYRKFLDWTIELESKVELLDHVPNNKIQRANSATPGGLVDLFLD
ncbi:unnamed protein product [Cylindrotheca closterium]|uniref:Uncharacterized protein n=1 Tax=Cylindrotheca closterium TaxID=2856 RepID=A0AAD2PW67_9STRA|nr:unnamed protein product [Cylindrotheca closterium]